MSNGNSVPLGGGGYLVLTRPWPAMLRGIYGDPERYKATYWSRFPGLYFAGDGAKRDEEGYLWLLGRVDDVMNVVRPPDLDHRGRVRAGRPSGCRRGGRRRPRRPISGQAIFAFVILRVGLEASDELAQELRRARRARSSARSPSRSTCSSRPTCPRPARARSCAACCATSPRVGRWATRRRSPTRAWSSRSASDQGRPRNRGSRRRLIHLTHHLSVER